MLKRENEVEALTLYAVGKYKAARPASWRHQRGRWILDGGSPQGRRQSLWIPLPIAPRFEWDELWRPAPWRPRGITPSRPWRPLPPKNRMHAGPPPERVYVFPSDGAEWLFRHAVQVEVASKPRHKLSTFVPFVTHMRLLDARREEHRGGLTGRNDEAIHGPKSGGLAPDGGVEIDNLYPLAWRPPDALAEACRAQMLEHFEADTYRRDGRRFSKPTQRALIRARGLPPTAYLIGHDVWESDPAAKLWRAREIARGAVQWQPVGFCRRAEVGTGLRHAWHWRPLADGKDKYSREPVLVDYRSEALGRYIGFVDLPDLGEARQEPMTPADFERRAWLHAREVVRRDMGPVRVTLNWSRKVWRLDKAAAALPLPADRLESARPMGVHLGTIRNVERREFGRTDDKHGDVVFATRRRRYRVRVTRWDGGKVAGGNRALWTQYSRPALDWYAVKASGGRGVRMPKCWTRPVAYAVDPYGNGLRTVASDGAARVVFNLAD